MSNKQADDYLVIGKIGSTYGIKGWLKILSYTEVQSNVLDYKTWYIEDLAGWKSVKIEEGREQVNNIIAKLEGYNNPEQARLLSGKKIAILRSDLPTLAANEYYWSDLTGLTVINQRNEVLGKVIYLIATGSNDVLVVKGDKEHAIPYVPGDVVIKVDLQKGELHVNWEEI